MRHEEARRMVDNIFRVCGLVFFLLILLGLYGALRLGRFVRKEKTLSISDVTTLWETTPVVSGDDFHPYRLTVFADDSIYATDANSGCVWLCRPNITPELVYSGLENPTDIAVDTKRRVWVIAGSGRTVQLISPDGSCIAVCPSEIKRPCDLAYDSSNHRLVILDIAVPRIISLNERGQLSTIISDHKKLLHSIRNARAVTVGKHGILHLIDGHGTILTIFNYSDRKKNLHTRGSFRADNDGGTCISQRHRTCSFRCKETEVVSNNQRQV